ncbi:quiescin-sulfhydryl oxidase 1 [Perilla frutescens var. hirtella]|nr:quiescin-sulfhydryl oxidase 1 [Perilla frutescens var. hirtella]
MSVVALLLALYVADVGAPPSPIPAPFSVGSRSLLRSTEDDGDERLEYAVELNATDFDAVLEETSAAFAIVEFFAHWCPACRNYKPHYERVAKLFNSADAVHPGIIVMIKVDCALQINVDLCDKFSVGLYPMLLWGPPSKFLSRKWEPKQDTSEIRSIEDGRTADRLLNWINEQINSSYALDDKKYEDEHLHPRPNALDPVQKIEHAIHDIEESTAIAFDIILRHKMISSKTRASLVTFFQLLVVHHPSRRCRKGISEILVDFSADKKEIDEISSLRNDHICGKEVPHGHWIYCLGSNNETRGFSCGLWVLFHSLSVRVDDGDSHTAFTTICDFIHNFFPCEECRQHFDSMCSSVHNSFKKARDFALWLWNAHNRVNERLMKEEASLGTADPKYPKTIWPPRQLCPTCYTKERGKDEGNHQTRWDYDEVYRFLHGYYGEALTTPYKDTSVVGVPAEDVVAPAGTATAAIAKAVHVVGATLAIAAASCAFGALICYRRRRHASWKYKYHPHALKIV